MSESGQILTHDHAVADYLKELLTEPAHVASDEPPQTDWKQLPFQAQLIRVAGLKLAIPGQQITAILTPEDNLSTAHQDMSDKAWYMDTIYYQDKEIHRVNTANIIFPPGYPVPDETAEYTVVLEDSQWGLCCHQIESVITIEPAAVTWRKQAGKRIWLAGTLLEQKLSIINVEGLITLLDNEISH